jgi:hypothetical protein
MISLFIYKMPKAFKGNNNVFIKELCCMFGHIVPKYFNFYPFCNVILVIMIIETSLCKLGIGFFSSLRQLHHGRRLGQLQMVTCSTIMH